jgi:hypothetical protein
MALFYRIFGRAERMPKPGELVHLLGEQGFALTAHVDGDPEEWFRLEFLPQEGTEPLCLERYLSDEEGIRHELNSWAAILETCPESPHNFPLMERVIQTRQLFTLRGPDNQDEKITQVCVALCRAVAGLTEGFFQVDGQGFFAADGAFLVRED